MQKTRVLLIGAGGYGELYVKQLAAHATEPACEWVGVVDPFARKSGSWALIERENVPVYDTPEAFFAEYEADLTVIATPIPLHAPQCIAAMEHGSDVLLEKPIAGSSEIAREIIAARDRLQRRLYLGYQWCYDDAMLRFKTASDQGLFGRPQRMRSLVLWPRGHEYYARNNWAGKALVHGNPVYDSVSSNATAHYLFNMLWIAGGDWNGVAPKNCAAVTARANDIETFDTAAMRFTLANGTEILHIASHATGPQHKQEPMFLYEFENATVRFGGFGELPGHIVAEFKDGRALDFGQSILQGEQKLTRVLKACENLAEPIICPAEAALQHTLAIEMARKVAPEPHVFRKVQDDGEFFFVDGLAARLEESYRRFELPDLNF